MCRDIHHYAVHYDRSEQSIIFEHLPKTFQDAITITRKFGNDTSGSILYAFFKMIAAIGNENLQTWPLYMTIRT